MDQKTLTFDSDRPFGTETEVLSEDKRDFKRNPLQSKGELPLGMDYIATIISKIMKEEVVCNKWHSTHNNNGWVLKPDSSCGIEICSPVYRGMHGITKVVQVTHALSKEPKVAVDDRCGFHVHIGVGDCEQDQMGAIVAYWIKCEPMFMDSVPANRKRNRYCQLIGASNLFDSEDPKLMTPAYLIQRVGNVKYYSLNTFHMSRGSRSTMEVRIGEAAACLDPFYVKNWVRLIIHFVERAKAHGMPPAPVSGDDRTGLLWFDLPHFMEFMGFDGPLSPGLIQVRNWVLARMMVNIDCQHIGAFSMEGRKIAKEYLYGTWKSLGLGDAHQYLRPENLDEALYGAETKI